MRNTLCGAGVGGRKGIDGYRIVVRLKVRLVLKPRIRHVKMGGFAGYAAAPAAAADVVGNRRFFSERGGRR